MESSWRSLIAEPQILGLYAAVESRGRHCHQDAGPFWHPEIHHYQTIHSLWEHLGDHGLRSQINTKFWALTLLWKPRGRHSHQGAGPFWHPGNRRYQTIPL